MIITALCIKVGTNPFRSKQRNKEKESHNLGFSILFVFFGSFTVFLRFV